MKIMLEKKAEEYFNGKIAAFLNELKPAPQQQMPQNVNSSASYAFVSGHLTNPEISSIRSLNTLTGKLVSRFFIIDKKTIGFDQNSYAEFDKFIENLYQRKEINAFLSKSFISDCAFEWFEKKYKGALPKESNLIDYLKAKAEGAIRKYRISLPVSFLFMEKPFKVGNVSFDFMDKAFCDRYISNARSKITEKGKLDENNFDIFETRFRKRYQGTALATVSSEAEKQRCIEIARLQVEEALTVLRFFSPSAFIPEIPSYFGLMGQTDIPQSYYFVSEADNNIPRVKESVDERRTYEWNISAQDFSEMCKIGFDLASDLIAKEDYSEFEDLILNSMSLFGRSLTSRNYQDKIVYALVSIETLLLQNQTEPIQSSVGLRMAFLVESDAQNRKDVKDMTSKAYKFRSSYIHHGKNKEDWELLRDLQHSIWTAIRNALACADKFKIPKDFIAYIENMILS